MLINPYAPSGRELIAPIPGTRILENTLGIVGAQIYEPHNAVRAWTIQALYTPITGRAIGGIRAKLVDQKQFITFCNQRDLEVLLEIASPEGYCPWLGQYYVGPDDPEWVGLCVDEQDLLDDLYDRELEARASLGEEVLPAGLSFERRVHNGRGNDYLETMLLRWDCDPETGMSPDVRFETISRRWASVERTSTAERSRLWLCL